MEKSVPNAADVSRERVPRAQIERLDDAGTALDQEPPAVRRDPRIRIAARRQIEGLGRAVASHRHQALVGEAARLVDQGSGGRHPQSQVAGRDRFHRAGTHDRDGSSAYGRRVGVEGNRQHRAISRKQQMACGRPHGGRRPFDDDGPLAAVDRHRFDPLRARLGGQARKQHEALTWQHERAVWSTSCRAASSTVSRRGAPPSAETIHSAPSRTKTMPAGLHASTAGEVRAGGHNLSLLVGQGEPREGPAAGNERQSAPSGEKTALLAPFVPGTSIVSARSSRRTNRRRPESFTPIMATARPSGEIAIPPVEWSWAPRRAGTRCRNASSHARSCRRGSGPIASNQPAAPLPVRAPRATRARA